MVCRDEASSPNALGGHGVFPTPGARPSRHDNPVRQTAFFSATLDQEVASLTQPYQSDLVTDHVGGDDNYLEAAHYFWQIDPSDRIEVTADITPPRLRPLSFTRTRHGADKVARLLERHGIRAAAIHGGRNQC